MTHVDQMRHGVRAITSLLVVTGTLAAFACGSDLPKRNVIAPPSRAQPTACMPKPSACGFPDVTNTGVAPGTPLIPVKGVVTLDQSGEVYENKQVTGSIIVTAANVTIRNVRLIATDPYYGISVKAGNDWENEQANLLVEHVEVDLNGNLGIKGIAFNGYTLRHSFLHNGADCAHFNKNVTIEDSLCVTGPDANNEGWPDTTAFCNSTEHFDGFQANDASDSTIHHNTVRNPCSQTSAIALFGSVRNIMVDNNLVAGGGYSLYCGSPNATNVTVSDNRFARTWYPRSGNWGRTAHCESGVVLTRNVWDGDAGRQRSRQSW